MAEGIEGQDLSAVATLPPRERTLSTNPVERLNPFEFEDADGAKREIFTFNNKRGKPVKVVFYTREELPYNKDIISGQHSVILGEPPKHRDQADWNQFLGDIRQNSEGFLVNSSTPLLDRSIDQGKAIFFVENTPVHMLNLAFRLGLEGPQWRDAMQKAALSRVYTPDVLNLIDDAIAGTSVDDAGNFQKRQNQRGEALAILALLGDKQAREILDKKKGVITQKDHELEAENAELARRRYEELSAEGIKLPNGVWATHVTKFKPEITEQGVLLRSSFDGTNGQMTRNTIHFSLNGPVSDALGGGGWEKMPYVISGDLSKMKDANGKPLMVNPVDTYFLVNPGQPLLIPDAEVEMPGQLPPGVIRETIGNITYYKDENLTPADIDTLFKNYYDGVMPVIQKELQDWLIRPRLNSWLNSTARDLYEAPDQDVLSRIYDYTRKEGDVDKFFTDLRTVGVEQSVRNLLNEAQVNIFDDHGVEEIGRKVENFLIEKIRNESFNESTNYEYGVKEKMLLGASWGSKVSNRSQAHSEDSAGGFGLEFAAGRLFKDIEFFKAREAKWEEESQERGETHHLKSHYEAKELRRYLDLDDRTSVMGAFRDMRVGVLINDDLIRRPQSRRMLYVGGVI